MVGWESRPWGCSIRLAEGLHSIYKVADIHNTLLISLEEILLDLFLLNYQYKDQLKGFGQVV